MMRSVDPPNQRLGVLAATSVRPHISSDLLGGLIHEYRPAA